MLLVLFSAPELLFYPALLVAAVILIVKASATFLHVDQVKACSLLVSSAEGNLESSYQFVLKLLIWLTGGKRDGTSMATSLLMVAKSRVERHLDWRAKELGIEGNPSISEKTFLLLFFLPLFLLTCIFRLSSLALIVAWFPDVPDPVLSIFLVIAFHFVYG